MEELANKIAQAIINPLIILLIAVALLVFLWGVFQFIYHAEDETKRKEGLKHITYGIMGLTIMVGAWGIMRFIDSSLRQTFPTEGDTLLQDYEEQVDTTGTP